MKVGIHPNYEPATIECACGNSFQTYSALGSYKVEICAACHPFYTGKQKIIDSAGRVEKFKQRYGRKSEAQAES